jgi:hypothetical protein
MNPWIYKLLNYICLSSLHNKALVKLVQGAFKKYWHVKGLALVSFVCKQITTLHLSLFFICCNSLASPLSMVIGA